MAGLISAARLFGRPVTLNSKCVSYCFTRYLSAESKRDGKPKRPTTHFLLYYKNIKNELDKNNPGVKVTEKVKIASQMYKEISDAEKQTLQVQSVKLLDEYKEKMKKWKESLSIEDKNEIKSGQEKKKKMKIKRLQRVNNKPKAHGNFYTLFVADQLKAVNLQFMSSQERVTAVRKNLSDCAERWKKLPDAEKEVYRSLAKEERESYNKEMQKWEQNMIAEGKEKLVRKGTLQKHQTAVRKTARAAARTTKSPVKRTSSKKAKSTRTKKSVAKKYPVKSTKASSLKSGKEDKSTPKKKVRFADEESESKKLRKDFYSSDSD